MRWPYGGPVFNGDQILSVSPFFIASRVPLSVTLSLSLVRFQGTTSGATPCPYTLPTHRVGYRDAAHGVAQTVSKGAHTVTTIEKPTIHEVAAKSRDITKFALLGFHVNADNIAELLRRVADDTLWLVRTERGQVTEIAQVNSESVGYFPVGKVTLDNDEVSL